MERFNIGVDLHKTQFTICCLSGESFLWEGQYSTNPGGYAEFKRRILGLSKRSKKSSVYLAVESTGNTKFFKNTVETWGCKVHVVNTLKFKVINESVKKTDKHDARTLAEFLSKDMIPEAHLCSWESEELRRLLHVRRTLTRAVVTVKNQIHGMMNAHGLESLKGGLQSEKGRQRILGALTGIDTDPVTGLVAQQLFQTISLLLGQIKDLVKTLEQKVANDEVVKRLQTIPGCGLITASTIRAALDDIGRFPGPKQFAAYAGLAPWVQCSNTSMHYGKITKRGPEELRTALVQLVLGMYRSRVTAEFRIMKSYRYMKSNKGSGKSIIATARKLAVIIWQMLSEKKDFDPEKMLDHNLNRKAVSMRAASIEKSPMLSGVEN
jgi:transposase